MPKVKYYCYLEVMDIRIYKGTWAQLQVISEGLRREHGTGLSGKDNVTLEKAIALIESSGLPFNPSYAKFYDFTAVDKKSVMLDQSPEYERLPSRFVAAPVALSAFLEVWHSEDDVVSLITSMSAVDLNATHPQTGRSLLHYCAQYNYPRAMTQLLDKNIALLDVQDVHGYTALHCAYDLKFIDVARILMAHRADHTKRTKTGASAEPVGLLRCDITSPADIARVQSLSRLLPSMTYNSVRIHFGFHERSGARWLDRLESEPYGISGTSLMQHLAEKYPGGFVNGSAYPWSLKEGLAIRHIRSVNSISRELIKKYQGQAVDALLSDKSLVVDYALVQAIGREYRDQVIALDNVFIGCAIENGIYGSLIPLINAALDHPAPVNERGAFAVPVDIPVPPAAHDFIERHSMLKAFFCKARGAFECKDIGRLRALARIIHYDDPKFAAKVVPAVPLVMPPALFGSAHAVSPHASAVPAHSAGVFSEDRKRHRAVEGGAVASPETT